MNSQDVGTGRIGFLGVGVLGAPIAERLARAKPIVAFDPKAGSMGALRDVEFVNSPKEVADRADIVFACLAEKSHHRDALFGSQGVVNGLCRKLYVHLGTSGSSFLKEVEGELSAAGIATVDAPVTGGPPKARLGELTSIVSGDAADIAAAREAIGKYSEKIVVAGERPGQAQTLKLVNNAIALTNLVATCEAMVVGAKAGLGGTTMLEVINSGSGQNRASLSKLPENILPRSFDFGATLSIVIKDLELFLTEPAALSMRTETCRSALEAFRRARDEGVEIDDLTAVVRPMERLAGAEVRR